MRSLPRVTDSCIATATGVLTICFVVLLAPVLRAQTVQVWLTTPDLRQALAQQPPLSLNAMAPGALTIRVDENVTYQQMDGFGASLTDTSAWLIENALTPDQRDRLMRQLFDRDTGIGISFLRQPMGASDFVVARYNFAEQPDPTLSWFSIAHDEQYIIPLLRQALALNPKLKIMGTPWSPPGWMKSSGSMLKGRLLNSAHDAWANYFVNFVQAYAAAGVPLYAVSVQNEPTYLPSDYPGMAMSATEQAALVREHLGPALARAGLAAKIMVYDDSWGHGSYASAVLADAGANTLAAGAAFHCYNGHPEVQTAFHDRFPDKDVWETECSPGLWSPAGNKLQQQAKLLIGAARNWARSLVLWNLTLDAHNGPRIGGCKSCTPLVAIRNDLSPTAVTMNAEYYALGHASKFVVPGAYRVDSDAVGQGVVQHVAFRNPDGSLVLLAANMGLTAVDLRVWWSGKALAYTLPGGSLATFRWTPAILPAVALSTTPGGLAIQSGDSGTLALGLEPQNALLPQIRLTCSGLPAEMSCEIVPSTLSFSAAYPATATVTVRTSSTATSGLMGKGALLGLALLGIGLLPRRRRVAAVALFVLAASIACGVGQQSRGEMYRLTIAATPNTGAATVITAPVLVR